MDVNKVLIIDDEEDICLLLSSLLKSTGYKTSCAGNLEEGMKKYRNFKPDLVFLDLNLPDGSGFSIIPAIRKVNGYSEIIIISAYNSSLEKKRAQAHNVHFFIDKPFKLGTIKDVVKKIERKNIN